MNELLKKIKYFFLAMQEKDLQEKLKKTTKKSFINKTSKKIIAGADDLIFNSETLKIIDEVKENVSAIVKKTNCNPDELLSYVKAAKTPIYKLANADKILNLIKEEEGLIYEKRGLEALYLNIMTGQGMGLKSSVMFVLRDGVVDKFYMLHNFYRWYSLKSGLPGFEYNVQRNFKTFLFDNSDDVMKRFSMEEIISLKEAIARDQEATAFVLEYTKQVDGSKKVIEKIKNDGGANI